MTVIKKVYKDMKAVKAKWAAQRKMDLDGVKMLEGNDKKLKLSLIGISIFNLMILSYCIYHFAY